ncbi:hypothetical protein I4I73_27655 [Pseudonocardia sp. KRD-184]|uniref:Uncharacterized protein n=1 Tax=Pseudonocardia oceani TaxID=2792013 RepID=A0ABS6U9L3_9PSEU|nr:UPF0158 family protein [Pseudonocardia oceani]MBW0093235.1 hypothetical protein [Pseudonocardia oceani]MBW0099769.1 hypothetical protein [Pseudonocardia oceani]MBW0112430.1 hypothetical protein [Pseudonocardia oceani]MBW0124605.1 hypothetical protein [Pseudonocardia oceani]MBW0128932.1 hypothetical protein [Pseudonocardia oceani]
MLDPESVDLDELCAALEDRTPGTSWWIDPGTGAISSHLADVGAPRPSGVRIRRTESRESYQDMAQFVAAVHHRRAADLLDRAISGPGAFRRFKDTLFEFPELRDQWFRYRGARARRRAVHWLADVELIGRADAERLAAAIPDPVARDEDLPAAVAVDLGMLYGDRLEQVLLFGSWVRGNGPGEFDLQLLVVLSDLRWPWEELHRMDDVLWRHTERTGFTVTALPVSAAQLADPHTPLLARAAAEARLIA